MDKRNVVGVNHLRWAVTDKHSNMVLSIHQHPDSAEEFRNLSQFADDFEVVELLDEIWWRQR